MPRDLEQARLDLAPLEISPAHTTAREGSKDIDMDIDFDKLSPVETLTSIHPYAQILGLGDLESCLRLEEVTFPENQRCSREKFLYRLGTCNELCLGLFSPIEVTEDAQQAVTAATAKAPDSASPERKSVLLGHVIATKTRNNCIKDADMEIPPGHEGSKTNGTSDLPLGHQEDGETIAVHSLAILPAYHGKGLGTILFKDYIQRLMSAEAAKRISILTYPYLVPFYETHFGFKNKGDSDTSFGGGAWTNMTLEFSDPQARALCLAEEDEDEDE